MPRWLIVLTSIVLLLLGAASMYVIEAGSSLELRPSDRIGPTEFVSIILTALAVILGALTLMIGVLAIMGWSAFQSIVERKAEDSATEYLEERFSERDADYLQFVEDIKEDVRVRLLNWTRETRASWDDGNVNPGPTPDDVEADAEADPDS